MEFCHVHASEACRYSFYSDLCSIDLNLCTKVTGHLKGGLIIPAWGVSMKTGCSLCQCSRYDRSLCEALRYRHLEWLWGIYELEIAVHLLAHLIRRPLARRRGLGRTEGRICIWSPMFQALQS